MIHLSPFMQPEVAEVGLIFPGLHRGQVLISRAILVFHLDILAPLSKVDENMRRAHEVDATRRKDFFFKWQGVYQR